MRVVEGCGHDGTSLDKLDMVRVLRLRTAFSCRVGHGSQAVLRSGCFAMGLAGYCGALVKKSKEIKQCQDI